MTKQEWSVVKQFAIDKWEDAIKQTEDTYQEWWEHIGSDSCSFCRNFPCADKDIDLPCCPLQPIYFIYRTCCKEWRYTRDAKTYKSFIKYAQLLLNRIKAIKYKNEWKELVCILEDL